MALTDEERQIEVQAALTDAGYADPDVHLMALPNLGGTEHVSAVWYRPWTEIATDDRHLRDPALLAAANDECAIGRHRIAVPAHPEDRIMFAALLRHELEHARQWDALGGDIFDLHDFLEYDVLPEVVGGLSGCAGHVINSIPTELDCNAAASVYVAARFVDDDLDTYRNGSRRFLFCSLLGPAPHSSLVARMVAFAYVHRTGVEAHAERREFPVKTILRSVHPAAPTIWAALNGEEDDS